MSLIFPTRLEKDEWLMTETWMGSKVQVVQSYSSHCSDTLTEGGTHLRSEETEVTMYHQWQQEDYR